MRYSKLSSSIICFLFLIISSNTFCQDKTLISKEFETKRSNAYENQLANYLKVYLVDEYEERAANAWNRDYSSIDAFRRSVEPNRQKWESMVMKPPVLRKSGQLQTKPYLLGDVKAEWIKLPLGLITAEGILAFPAKASKDKPVPIIIVQHGIGSDHESPFEENGDLSKEYHAYAKA